MQKVKIGELITNLVKEIDMVDASDLPQGDKTKKYKAAAQRFKNALFTDKRKFRGKGLEKRITSNTYNAYMSRARKRFDDRLHHGFARSIERLAERYPLYGAELQEWLGMAPAEIRQQKSAMLVKLRNIMTLAEELSDVKLGTKAAGKRLVALANKYPAWQFALHDLNSDDWKSARDHLHKLFQQGTRLLAELDPVRVNHDVLYSLQLTPSERSSIQQRWVDVLNIKKRTAVLIDYPAYMQGIYDILNAPVSRWDLTTRVGMAPLAFALAAVSGRRLIEIMLRGEFTPISKYAVEFTGHVKKRTDTEKVHTIYTLYDSKLFVERLNALRGCPAAADFEEAMQGYGDLDTRSENARISDMLSGGFNIWVKRFFNDERRVYKDSRSLYARIAYEMWFRHDAKWAGVDEDVFFGELLGHEDESTQMHYKQFKLHNFTRTWKPDTGEENLRLAQLQELDDEMPGFSRGDAAVRLHEAVKSIIDENPEAKITNSTLRKYGFNTLLISRYLEFAADALGQEVGENGQYQLKQTSAPIVLRVELATTADEVEESEGLDGDDENDTSEDDDEALEDDEIELDESSETEPEVAVEPDQPAERPRFAAPHKKDDGTWQISYEFAGKSYSWIGPAENIRDAMQKAWAAYH